MSINHSLLIKYGLSSTPTDQQVQRWVELVETLVLSGADRETAGSRAAQQIFSGFNTRVYASEADTIESLLAAARNRGNTQQGS